MNAEIKFLSIKNKQKNMKWGAFCLSALENETSGSPSVSGLGHEYMLLSSVRFCEAMF
jgi:hypothetical protein